MNKVAYTLAEPETNWILDTEQTNHLNSASPGLTDECLVTLLTLMD